MRTTSTVLTYEMEEETRSDLRAWFRVAPKEEDVCRLTMFLSATSVDDFVTAMADVVDFVLHRAEPQFQCSSGELIDAFLHHLMVVGFVEDKDKPAPEDAGLPF